MYARIEVGIFHNRGNLCNEKSGLQQNPFQIRGYSRIENSRIEVLLYKLPALRIHYLVWGPFIKDVIIS